MGVAEDQRPAGLLMDWLKIHIQNNNKIQGERLSEMHTVFTDPKCGHPYQFMTNTNHSVPTLLWITASVWRWLLFHKKKPFIIEIKTLS